VLLANLWAGLKHNHIEPDSATRLLDSSNAWATAWATSHGDQLPHVDQLYNQMSSIILTWLMMVCFSGGGLPAAIRTRAL